MIFQNLKKFIYLIDRQITGNPQEAAKKIEVSERTMEFNSNSTHTLGAQSIAQKMGYGDMGGSTSNRGGLGVTTGLPGLDRILNRDNSELVKKFKR